MVSVSEIQQDYKGAMLWCVCLPDSPRGSYGLVLLGREALEKTHHVVMLRPRLEAAIRPRLLLYKWSGLH
ncbi:hypothetical protein CesoFtcFv8_014813 [Champsocephalus esox]|uniref:Uncharacterized protein n=1 Tax=Champsocephalus esox TaxID=159716 RepID=A0AAN8BPR1_9TELE|nr:hypothetical protein CesoFtcFv8_014813 [Champsocephalus esox]